MKKVFLIIFSIWALSYADTLAAQSSCKDSLLLYLNSLPQDSTRLKVLSDLANEKILQKDYISYANLLLTEAQKQKNSYYQSFALLLYMKYYYSRNTDSLTYWLKIAEPVFLKGKHYEFYFRTKAWNIYVLTRMGKKRETMTEIERLKIQADSLNYPDGKDMANQALANFYFSNQMPEKGAILYEEVLQHMEKRNVPLIKQINIIRQLINLHPDHSKKLIYLKQLEVHIDECKAKGIDKLDNENPIYYLEYIMHRSYAAEYINLSDYAKAKMHLNMAEKISTDNKMANSINEIRQLYVSYYLMTKEYNKSCQLADTLLSLFRKQKKFTGYLSILDVKADALMKMGNNREAVLCYKELRHLSDSLSKVTYYDQLAKIQTQYDLNRLTMENQRMELEAVNSRTKVQLLYGGMFTLFLICLLLGYFVYARHQYGIRLKAAKEKAEEADRMKSAFLANMNHEIRTPLNAIVGFSELMIDEEDRETRVEFDRIIRSNNELLQRLVSDVLDISKLESNMMNFSYKEISLPQLMKEIYSIILLRMPSGVELILKDSPDITVSTDRNRLTQVITNLLTNAIKHTEKGFISFGYEVIQNEVKFFVTDTGKGIPADQQEKIFSRFVQLNDWTQGVGLGLAISKGIVTKMGGHIGVISEVGKGSTFSFTIPFNHQNG